MRRYSGLVLTVALILVGAAGLSGTAKGDKTVRLILGEEPGAVTKVQKVRVKSDKGEHLWVSVNDPQPNGVVAWYDRLYLPEDVWGHYSVGDEIEVIYLPEEQMPHHREMTIVREHGSTLDRGLRVFFWLALVGGLVGSV